MRETAAAEDERLQRGSMRAGDGDWVEEPQRRAQIARRVIPEAAKGDLQRGGSQMRAALHPEVVCREHSDLFSVMNFVELRCENGAALQGHGKSKANEVSLVSGLSQLSASVHSDTQWPLLYRDSMNTSSVEWPTPQVRKKSRKGSGPRDGQCRHRERVNVRVTGRTHRRLRGKSTSSLLSSLFSSNGSTFGMEGELDVSELRRNGCGIPWYWSGMHKYKGRRFLDLAGKSLACGVAERSVKKDDKQSSSNSHRDLIPADRSVSLDKSSVFPDWSSDFEHPHFDADVGESPRIPRIDGELLTAERSAELVFGSTREYLSGMLIPQSPRASPRVSIQELEENSDLSFSQKYRPRLLGELLGQNIVTTSLSTAILKGKISSAYLFHGPPGTGKTSAARIFAEALTCIPENVDMTRPCGFCTKCTNPSLDIRKFNASGDSGIDAVKTVLGSFVGTPTTSPFRVLIIDDCHCFTAEAWNLLLKALEKPPRHFVFILTTMDAEKVPCSAIARCQRFLFCKIREVDIISRLQFLAREEGFDIEESALSLVAALSQGSLRDAETTVEQLSLMGAKISLSMVQEMAGLVSHDKLIDLLDLAMSAEAVNTVRCMRELLDGGIEPLALVTQLATLITDILAGTYVVSRDELLHGFFCRSSRKEEAVRLREALKILSDAEKQLRLSSDQPTWLTVALLQFAPDRSFQPSSAETSIVPSPIQSLKDTVEKETVGDSIQTWTSKAHSEFNLDKSKGGCVPQKESQHRSSYAQQYKKNGTKSSYVEAKIHPAELPLVNKLVSPDDSLTGRLSNAKMEMPVAEAPDYLNQREFTLMSQRKLEEVWKRVVVQGSRSNALRQLLHGRGKLLSLLISDAFAVVHLEFRHPEHKARAERSRARICNAFQMALGCPVELKIALACMPCEHQLSFTSFEDQTPIFDGLQKDKAKFNMFNLDGRSLDSKGSLHRRQRSSQMQQTAECMDIPQSLYNAVMGDSKGFKPEILQVVNSSKWGWYGGPRDGQHEECSERPEDLRNFMAPVLQNLEHSENLCRAYGSPLLSRVPSGTGKVPLKRPIHQYEDSWVSPNRNLRTDMFCGSSSKRKNVKFKDVNIGHSCVNSGHTASMEKQNLRLEYRLKPSQIEPHLLCWRVQNMDEDKINIQRHRRQRRVRVLLNLVPCAKSSHKHHTRPQQKAQTI